MKNHESNSVDLFSWSVHPFREEGRLKSSILVLSILFVSLYFGIVLNWSHGFMSFLLLIVSLSKYLFPTHFKISVEGLQVRFLFFEKNRSWKYYRRVDISKWGAFLSPFSKPSRLDSFRGDFLSFKKCHDSENMKLFIKKNLGVS